MIIVTGGAGFIGSNIISRLNESGEKDIVVVDDLEKGAKFKNLKGLQIADYIDVDDFYSNLSASFLGKVRAVFHQGACSSTTETNGKYMLSRNFECSKKLFHYCSEQQVQFLYASSASVYGMGVSGFAETSSCEDPLNVYAYSKLLFDQYVRRNSTVKNQVVGLRYFNVYGPNEQHKENMASTIYHFTNQILDKGSASLFKGTEGIADGEQKRDFVYIDDCVAVNLWFFENKNISGIFNVGTGAATTFNHVANSVIGSLHSGSISYIEFPENLIGAYQNFTEANIDKLRRCGYDKPFKDVSEGVKLYHRKWLGGR